MVYFFLELLALWCGTNAGLAMAFKATGHKMLWSVRYRTEWVSIGAEELLACFNVPQGSNLKRENWGVESHTCVWHTTNRETLFVKSHHFKNKG